MAVFMQAQKKRLIFFAPLFFFSFYDKENSD